MPSSNSTVGELISRLESLLGGGPGNSPTIGSVFGSSVGGTLGSSLASGNTERVTERLTDGFLGGTGGLLAGLFRSLFRSDDKEIQSFTAYEKPGALFFEYDIGSSSTGSPAVNSTNAISVVSPQSSSNDLREQNPTPSVVVQVNALDAQSFSNRSDDIASAVREALSRNHALRDEIWED